MIPWTEKYRPKKLKEVIGNSEAKKKIFDFIKNFSSQRKKALMLHGPAGSGKTSIAYALASEFGYEIIEMNASDFRTKYNMRDIIGQALKQKSLFSKGKIVLIDEIDGITGTKDRGGLKELIRLIAETKYPIILVANDAWQAKLRPLRSKAQFIEFKALDKKNLVSLLKIIAEKEKMKVSFDALEYISSMARGDARAAITDIQILSSVCKEITKKDALNLYSREKDENIFNALRQIFKAKSALNVFDNVQNINYDDLFLWIDENLPLEYKGKELVNAYNTLSKADVFRGRIRRWQHWRFLTYIRALLTEGIANSKEKTREGFTSYKPPSRILKIWIAKQKQAKRKEQAEKLAKIMHTSKKRAYKELPFLEIALSDSITNL